MPRPMLTIPDPNRTFGVELEIYGISPEGVTAALIAAGVPVYQYRQSTFNTRNLWIPGSDGTIRDTTGRGSCELKSPILRGQEGLDQLYLVCRTLIRAGARVNRSCGLHVHHQGRDITLPQMQSLVKRYIKAESLLDCLVAPSRRSSQSRWCRSLLVRHEGNRAQAVAAVEAARNIGQLRDAISASRYTKVNLHALGNHGTVEFRHHSGSLHARKVCAWVCLTQAMIVQGRTVAPGNLTPQAYTDMTLFLRHASRQGNLCREAVRFLKRRYDRLTRPASAPETESAE